MQKEEPSTSSLGKKQNGKKKEEGTYPENIEDPRVLQPSRDYTNFGYNPDTKPKASNEGSSKEPSSKPITDRDDFDELEEFKRIERSLIEDNRPNLDELEEFQRIENSIIQDKEVSGMRVGLKYNNAISFGNEEEF